jgi:uncharacterized protein YjbI with pentapeptide repeats
MNKLKNSPLIVVAFFAGSLVSLTTTLVLAHGGDTNLIHACYNNSTGAVKIVGENDSCAGGETALDWNKLGLPGTGALLSDLSGKNFQAVNGAPRADLRYRNFKGASMSASNFFESHFEGSDLRDVNFSSANLRGAWFDGQYGNDDITTANFTDTDLAAVEIHNMDLSGNDLTGVGNLGDGGGFHSSNLSGTDFSGVNITDTFFESSNLTGADFSSTTNPNSFVSFEGSNLTNTDFTGASLVSGQFIGVSGSNTDFTNANLTGADFSGHSLTSIVWSNTTCPDGTNSNSHGNTCAGHL